MRHFTTRRSVGLILLAALLLAIASVSGTGTAAGRSAVACPQAQTAVGCCPGPVVAGAPPCCAVTTCCTSESASCCTSASCSGVTVSIRVSPDPVLEGRSIVVSGQATGADAASVALWQQLPGDQARQIAAGTTSASGAYGFTRPSGSVTTDRLFYVTVGTARSASITESVTASVRLSHSRGRAYVRRRVVLHGTVAPEHRGEVVLLQQRRGGRWRTLRRARLGRRSKVSIGLTFTRRGTVHLRLVLPGDARNAKSSSRVLALPIARP